MIKNIFDWTSAIGCIAFSLWLITRPIPSHASDHTIATKDPSGTHGWVYNSKTMVLQFCTQVSGDRYDAMAEVLCIPYPKKVRVVDEYESFLLDIPIPEPEAPKPYRLPSKP